MFKREGQRKLIERGGLTDDSVSMKRDRWGDEARAKGEDKNPYRRRTDGETSVSLCHCYLHALSVLICREQTDRQTWLTSQGHLAWSINLALTRTRSQAYSCTEPALMALLSL